MHAAGFEEWAGSGKTGGGGPDRPAARPLLVSEDPLLIDDLVRLAAAAGVELDVVPEPSAARGGWSRAPTVMVGADAARSCASAGLPRRRNTLLVSHDLDDASVWQQAVALGAEQVLFLPDAEQWLIGLLAEAVEGVGPAGLLVGVVGGRGGAGASVLAASLALTALRRGARTMLVDADPLGGGIDLVLGAESAAGLRWPDLVGSRGRVSSPALVEALPKVDEMTVLSWDRGHGRSVPAAAMCALLAAGQRSSDLVVVDLPRHSDPAAVEVLQRADQVLMVVPAEVRACASAARVAEAVIEHCDKLAVVVRGPAPAGLSAQMVAASLGLPLAGALRKEPGLVAGLERGSPPTASGKGPLATFCGQHLDRLLGPARASAA